MSLMQNATETNEKKNPKQNCKNVVYWCRNILKHLILSLKINSIYERLVLSAFISI